MKDSLIKIILRVIAYDVVFLILLRLAAIVIPHEPQESIYYINLNFHFILACLAWMNFRQSNVNKPIILIFSVLYIPYILIVLFYMFTSSMFSETIVWVNYHIAYFHFCYFLVLNIMIAPTTTKVMTLE